MVPGLWLNEGGQSAAGAAIDHLVRLHPAAQECGDTRRGRQNWTLGAWLAREAETRGGSAAVERLVGCLHVVPEFLGNRAPFADPDARALVAGMGMDSGIDSLVGLYLAGLCGLGYGARQIIAAQQAEGIPTDTIVVSGGAGQSPLVRQILADATGLTVAASTSPEPVLLGSAILAATAAGRFGNIPEAMDAMSELSEICVPDPATVDWHLKRFVAFKALQKVGREIRG